MKRFSPLKKNRQRFSNDEATKNGVCTDSICTYTVFKEPLAGKHCKYFIVSPDPCEILTKITQKEEWKNSVLPYREERLLRFFLFQAF